MADAPPPPEPRTIPPLVLGAKVSAAMLTGAGIVLVSRWLLHAGGGTAWVLADARWSVGLMLLLWGGVGLVVGVALGRTAWHRSKLFQKVGIGVLAGALAGAVGLALYSPVLPIDPGWRRMAGPAAVAALVAGMGAVGGALQGAVSAVVFDGVRQSMRQGVERAALCALAYVLWALVRG
jgi:hypothetical protein